MNPFSNENELVEVDHNKFSNGPRPPMYDARDDELEERKLALDRREAELEQKIRDLEASEKSGGAGNVHLNNWPIPKVWIFTYHSITDEIPFKYQPIVRNFYYLWLVQFTGLLYNSLLEFFLWIGVGDNSSKPGIVDVLFSIIFLMAGSVCSWRLWYRNIYFSLRKGSTSVFRWGLFFLNIFLFFLWAIFLALGIPGTPSAGLLLAFDFYTAGLGAAGTACLVLGLLWSLVALATAALTLKVNRLYTTGEFSGEAKAVQAMGTAMMRA
eukprot:992154_1